MTSTPTLLSNGLPVPSREHFEASYVDFDMAMTEDHKDLGDIDVRQMLLSGIQANREGDTYKFHPYARAWSLYTLASSAQDMPIDVASTLEEQQGGPILIQAVAVTRKDDEDGLRLEWLLEGGIAEMEFPEQVLFAMAEANDLCDEDGSAYVYLQPPASAVPCEAERLKARLQAVKDDLKSARQCNDRFRAQLLSLRSPSDRVLSAVMDLFTPGFCTVDMAQGILRAALFASAGAEPSPAAYQLLNHGDVIKATDQYLEEDGVTWLPVGAGIFNGMSFNRGGMLPIRRATSDEVKA
ncbi:MULTISPECIES: hypothetical protein [Pseudomonas]|uniref:hypothetical protein n=1 Tax=Pseudomonas TaxID=286 RepID=UPI003A8858B5